MKVISWNIQWGKGCDGRVDLERIVADARRMADFDVLCLQEVAANLPSLAGSSGENQFTELARLLPGYTAIDGPALDLPGADGGRRQFGNMIFSRYPVLQVFRHSLPFPHDENAIGMPRLLLEAVLQTPAGPLRVLNTHLDYFSARQRDAQSLRIRALHEEACAHARTALVAGEERGPYQILPRPASAILCGDFNCTAADPLFARMQEEFADGAPAYRDAWQVLEGDAPRPPTVGLDDTTYFPEPNSTDFIFVTADLAARVAGVEVDTQTRSSDHQPVLLTLD